MAWTKYSLTQVFGTGATQTISTVTIKKAALQSIGLPISSSNSSEQIFVALVLKAMASCPDISTANLGIFRWNRTFPQKPDGTLALLDSIIVKLNNTPIKEPFKLFNPNDF